MAKMGKTKQDVRPWVLACLSQQAGVFVGSITDEMTMDNALLEAVSIMAVMQFNVTIRISSGSAVTVGQLIKIIEDRVQKSS